MSLRRGHFVFKEGFERGTQISFSNKYTTDMGSAITKDGNCNSEIRTWNGISKNALLYPRKVLMKLKISLKSNTNSTVTK